MKRAFYDGTGAGSFIGALELQSAIGDSSALVEVRAVGIVPYENGDRGPLPAWRGSVYWNDVPQRQTIGKYVIGATQKLANHEGKKFKIISGITSNVHCLWVLNFRFWVEPRLGWRSRTVRKSTP